MDLVQRQQRVSHSLFDQGRIVVEACSVPRNIKPTARKYDVQTKQIRRWKKQGRGDDYLKCLLLVEAAYSKAGTDIPASDSDDDDDDDDIETGEETELQKALKQQRLLKKRKRGLHDKSEAILDDR